MGTPVLLLGFKNPQHLVGDRAHTEMLNKTRGVVARLGTQRHLDRIVDVGQEPRHVPAIHCRQCEDRLPGEHRGKTRMGIDVD